MLNELAASLDFIINQTKANAHYLELLVIIMVTVFFISCLTGHRLLYLGIIPRKALSLPGIFFTPFLHADANHLFFNLVPLVVLSDFLLLSGLHYFLMVTFCIIFISGLLTWCFARAALHVGASGLITGYWGLLVCNIYEQGTLMAILLGLLSLYYFAGIFFGIFPTQRGVSWEGHLFGLVAGIFTAFVLQYPY